MSEKIKPCPFCGGMPSTQFGFNASSNYRGRVICGYGAKMRQGRYDTEDDVISRWNRRIERLGGKR